MPPLLSTASNPPAEHPGIPAQGGGICRGLQRNQGRTRGEGKQGAGPALLSGDSRAQCWFSSPPTLAVPLGITAMSHAEGNQTAVRGCCSPGPVLPPCQAGRSLRLNRTDTAVDVTLSSDLWTSYFNSPSTAEKIMFRETKAARSTTGGLEEKQKGRGK